MAASGTLSLFPALTSDEFGKGLEELHHLCQRSSFSAWREAMIIQSEGYMALRLSTKLPMTLGIQEHYDGEACIDDEIHEIDGEEKPNGFIPAGESREQVLVVYDIILSSTYQVPVLYLRFKDAVSNRWRQDSELLERIIPRVLRHQVKDLGVMGAISMTDHPMTGLPAYFVHPCNTAQAMRDVCDLKTISPLEYLLKWIGLVGGGVGLSVPPDIFIQPVEPG